MELPIQISFRNMTPSPAVEADIREHAERLNRYFGRIIACRVAVKASTRRQHKGRIYHLRVSLTVPGREIVVKRDPSEHHAHEDILVAIRDAFDAVRRQLEDHARRSEGDEVRYSLHEGEGDKGPQASTVTPVGKHHLKP